MFDETLINNIRDLIVEKEETIACAESVTSGCIQLALSQAFEASKYFQGGITVYNLGQKARHLNVEPILAQKVNSVASIIAETLALEVSQKFISDFGIGITGYAMPVPECEEEGLFAFISIAYKKEIIISKKITSDKQGNSNVQLHYTHQVLQALYEWLQNRKTKDRLSKAL